MKSQDTKQRRDDAQARLTKAEQEHARAQEAFRTASVATKLEARNRMDEAEALAFEARLELERAEAAHAAALKAEELTRLRVAEDACRETRTLLEKEFRSIAALRDRLCQHVSQVQMVLTAHAQNAARARELGAKLGESVVARDIAPGIVSALALHVVSETSEHTGFDTAQLTQWLTTQADPNLRAEYICRLANPAQPRLADMPPVAAAKLYLDSLDDQALANARAERERLISVAAQAQGERAEQERVARMTPAQRKLYEHDLALYGPANAPPAIRANGARA
jgi:hypothetical protein